jgi:hypothetical protein
MKIRWSGIDFSEDDIWQGGSASPEDDVCLIAEDARYQAAKPHLSWQRVGDNAFHL